MGGGRLQQIQDTLNPLRRLDTCSQALEQALAMDAEGSQPYTAFPVHVSNVLRYTGGRSRDVSPRRSRPRPHRVVIVTRAGYFIQADQQQLKDLRRQLTQGAKTPYNCPTSPVMQTLFWYLFNPAGVPFPFISRENNFNPYIFSINLQSICHVSKINSKSSSSYHIDINNALQTTNAYRKISR